MSRTSFLWRAATLAAVLLAATPELAGAQPPAASFDKAALAWSLPWDADWVTAVCFLGPNRVAAGNNRGHIVVWDLPERPGGPAPDVGRQRYLAVSFEKLRRRARPLGPGQPVTLGPAHKGQDQPASADHWKRLPKGKTGSAVLKRVRELYEQDPRAWPGNPPNSQTEVTKRQLAHVLGEWL